MNHIWPMYIIPVFTCFGTESCYNEYFRKTLIVKNNYINAAVELINKSQNVLITTHIRPDGDACGSLLAMGLELKNQGKNVKYLMLSKLPDWYEFLFDEKPPVYDVDIKGQDLNHLDLIILVDVNSDNQLPKFCDYLKTSRNGTKVLVIDHHITNDGLGDVEIIDTGASSTGLIVYDLFKYANWPITRQIALPLFVAAATDTGWFQFSNTDARTLATVAELTNIGLNPSEIHKKVYQNFTPERFRLMTRMFDSLNLHFDGRYAEQSLTIEDFKQTGASYKDTENLIDQCRRIRTVEVAALFIECEDGKIRCSLRSSNDVDVRLIAQKFGGGGHTMASGVHLDCSMEQAKKKVYEAIREQL